MRPLSRGCIVTVFISDSDRKRLGDVFDAKDTEFKASLEALFPSAKAVAAPVAVPHASAEWNLANKSSSGGRLSRLSRPR